MHLKIVLLIMSFGVAPAFGQNGVGAPSKAQHALEKAVLAQQAPEETAARMARLQQENERMRLDSIESLKRLNALEASIAKASERADSVSARSSWFALITVLVSVIFGLVGQYILIQHQRRLNKEQEKAKVSHAYVEWQLRQLSELYGPLRALLGQSLAIYRQMNMVLIAADNDRFRLEQKPGADFDDTEFQVCLDGKWERFRTVEHLRVVYGKTYGVEPYFDDVVKAGSSIAEMIRASAGYVRHEDKELVKVMGTYLAHYGVLCRLHERAVKGEDVRPTPADIKASFPYVIHDLVDNGFNAINDQIMDWKNFRPSETI